MSMKLLENFVVGLSSIPF